MSKRRPLAVWLPTVRAGSGSDVFTERLAEGLNKRGIRAEVAWLPHRAEYAPWTSSRPVIPAWATIVHVNTWLPPRFLPAGVPVVATVHHLVHDPAFAPFRSFPQAAYHRFYIKPRERKILARASASTCVSYYVAKTVGEVFGSSGIRVIYNWIDTSRYTPGPVVRASSPFKLLMVGNQGRRKGGDLLRPLAHKLGSEFEIRCTGGLRHERAESRSENVTWLGRLDEEVLISEYQACDAVLSLSRYEGFGLSALEAMACAKPFVGFSCGGLPEVAIDGVTALLSPVDDVDGIVASCRRLKDDSDLGESLGARGLARVTPVFSETAAIDAYVHVYESLRMKGGT